jgi:hypothetical protein
VRALLLSAAGLLVFDAASGSGRLFDPLPRPEPAPSASVARPVQASPYRQAVVVPDPEAGVVALAIRFAGGSRRDPDGAEGAAFLLGRVLERQGNELLGRLGAEMHATVQPDEFLVTLLVVPERWRQAVVDLESLLYRSSLLEADVDGAKAEVLDMILFESGAPVRAFELERARFVLGDQDPAARPATGTTTTVPAIGLPELESFRSLNLRPEEAVLAATGPVEAQELSAVLSTTVRDLVAANGAEGPAAEDRLSVVDSVASPAAGLSGLGVDSLPPPPVLRLYRSEAPPLELPEEPLGPPAWTSGRREVLDRELTSTWICLAVPFPMGTPPLLLDFLSHLVLEALTPSPPDPDLYDAQVSTIDVRNAPVLVATVSVDPRATSRWEDRLRGTIEALAASPPEGAFFELARRRFRSSVLLDLALPENRAAWFARAVARGTDPDPRPGREIWRIRRPAVAALAASASPARVLLFGPEAMMDR